MKNISIKYVTFIAILFLFIAETGIFFMFYKDSKITIENLLKENIKTEVLSLKHFLDKNLKEDQIAGIIAVLDNKVNSIPFIKDIHIISEDNKLLYSSSRDKQIVHQHILSGSISKIKTIDIYTQHYITLKIKQYRKLTPYYIRCDIYLDTAYLQAKLDERTHRLVSYSIIFMLFFILLSWFVINIATYLKSKRNFQEIFDVTPNIMITTNAQEIDAANSAMLQFTNYATMEEFKKEHTCISEFFLKVDDCLVANMGTISWLDYILKYPQKTHKVCMQQKNKIHTFIVWAKVINNKIQAKSVVSFLDITKEYENEQKLKEQEELMLSQSRHAAMGEMISMIAHQWRQPISVIAMDANNILVDIELEIIDENSLKKGALNIIRQTQELSKTIEDFRNFFRPDKEIEKLLLKDVMQETFGVVRASLINNNIDIIEDFGEKYEIETYSRDLMQVLINILNNARDALVEHRDKQRKIIVSIQHRKEAAYIKICDNAGGIDEAIIGKIFNPYFSTKKEKNGTGIGLYMSKTIVEKHLNGSLNVFNNDDGACFEIALPHFINKDSEK